MATLLRVYSYLYHLLIALVLLAIGSIAMLSGTHNLKLEMLPWTGVELTNWVFWGGLSGIVIVLLAATGIFRYLLPLWSLVILVMMVQGFILRPYTFSGQEQFYWILALILGAFGAFLSSLTVFKMSRRR